MLQATQLIGFGNDGAGVSTVSQFLYDQIVRRSLTANLGFCIDAGDSRCFNGTGQTVADAAGSGNDFFRGELSSVETSDPGWTGSIGSWSDTTYFTFDGTQYFNGTGTHAYAADLHKNNGAFSIACIMYIPVPSAVYTFFTTGNEVAADAGIWVRCTAGGVPRVLHSITTTTRSNDNAVTTTMPTNSWSFIGISFDEATTSMIFHLNGANETGVVFAASTDTDAVAGTPTLCASFSAAGELFNSGMRLAAMAVWNRSLTTTDFGNLYTDAKLRIPAIP